ncbi:hypothetical protein ACQP1P_15990 [Dactylosporangium sp. CA-052675]|uniref:hypothetical protein n=1 Tax=Dactylosporangium sp. CA-052675 TaxID=3239927 RepID=UPI003D91CF91
MAEENRRLREEVAELPRVNEILRAAPSYFASRDRFAVALLLRALNIAESSAAAACTWAANASDGSWRSRAGTGRSSAAAGAAAPRSRIRCGEGVFWRAAVRDVWLSESNRFAPPWRPLAYDGSEGF